MKWTLKYVFLVTLFKRARALGYFYGALVSLYKDLFVSDHYEGHMALALVI